MLGDYYGQLIYQYLVSYIYPMLQNIDTHLATFNNNFATFVDGKFSFLSSQICFWLALFVFLFVGYKFMRIRSHTL